MSTTEGTASAARVSEVRTDAMSAIDEHYKRALMALPGMTEYLADLAARFDVT